MRSIILSLSFVLIPQLYASPLTTRADRPAYFLLAGDSTTAPKGGWGDGFLGTTVAAGSSGHNYGHSGATTASFRAGGDWGNVIKDIGTYKEKYDVFVTIQVGNYPLNSNLLHIRELSITQFGHNDQKETSGVSLSQYETNLKNFAAEASNAGGIPVSTVAFALVPNFR